LASCRGEEERRRGGEEERRRGGLIPTLKRKRIPTSGQRAPEVSQSHITAIMLL